MFVTYTHPSQLSELSYRKTVSSLAATAGWKNVPRKSKIRPRIPKGRKGRWHTVTEDTAKHSEKEEPCSSADPVAGHVHGESLDRLTSLIGGIRTDPFGETWEYDPLVPKAIDYCKSLLPGSKRVKKSLAHLR